MSKKSKKPSGTKAERLLEETTFYVDDCLGKSVALSLREAGWKTEWHRDHFQRDNVLDVEIYDYIGPKNWVMLTKDNKLRRNEEEVVKLVLCNLRVFSLSRNDMNSQQMVDAFLNHARAIGRLLKNEPAPFIAYVKSDSVEVPAQVRQRIATIQQTLLDSDSE